MKNKNTKGFNLLKKGKVAIPIVLITIVLVLSFLLTNFKNEEKNIAKIDDTQEALNGTEYIYRTSLNGVYTNNNVIILPTNLSGYQEYNIRIVELYKKNGDKWEIYKNSNNGTYKYF